MLVIFFVISIKPNLQYITCKTKLKSSSIKTRVKNLKFKNKNNIDKFNQLVD